MKLTKLWKGLTRVQKAAWNTWAKANPMLMDDGRVRRVTGQKACTLVMANRALFGWNYPVTETPAAYARMLPDQFLTNVDCGAYTTGAGSILLRTLALLPAEESNFLIWATPPVTADVVNPTPLFRFVKAMNLQDDVLADHFLPNLAADYRAKIGEFGGPGIEGFWEVPHFIWFRVHECNAGALGPANVFRCTILVDA